MPSNGTLPDSISRLAHAPERAAAALAREFGLTISQLRAIAMLVGDDRDRLRDAALRLKGTKPA